jgi:hypothetical protein
MALRAGQKNCSGGGTGGTPGGLPRCQLGGLQSGGIGLPGLCKLKDFLGNNLRRAIACALEPGLFARHPIGCAHGVYDLKPKAIHAEALRARDSTRGHFHCMSRGAEIIRVGGGSKLRSKSAASSSMASECQQAETQRIIAR